MLIRRFFIVLTCLLFLPAVAAAQEDHGLIKELRIGGFAEAEDNHQVGGLFAEAVLKSLLADSLEFRGEIEAMSLDTARGQKVVAKGRVETGLALPRKWFPKSVRVVPYIELRAEPHQEKLGQITAVMAGFGGRLVYVNRRFGEFDFYTGATARDFSSPAAVTKRYIGGEWQKHLAHLEHPDPKIPGLFIAVEFGCSSAFHLDHHAPARVRTTKCYILTRAGAVWHW